MDKHRVWTTAAVAQASGYGEPGKMLRGGHDAPPSLQFSVLGRDGYSIAQSFESGILHAGVNSIAQSILAIEHRHRNRVASADHQAEG